MRSEDMHVTPVMWPLGRAMRSTMVSAGSQAIMTIGIAVVARRAAGARRDPRSPGHRASTGRVPPPARAVARSAPRPSGSPTRCSDPRPAEITQPLPEGIHGRGRRGVHWPGRPRAAPSRRLRLGGERRGEETTASGQQGTPAGPSLDHLIRPLQERRRDGQAEGLGGLEVDDELELVGCSTGRSAGFAPLRILST